MNQYYTPSLGPANAIRLPRAQTLREMSALPEAQSRQRAAELIEDPPPELCSMEIERFLIRVRGTGPWAAGQLLESRHINPVRTLRALRVWDRVALAEALRVP